MRERDRIRGILRDASFAIDGDDNGLSLIPIKNASGYSGFWKVVDKLAANGPTEIFNGEKGECLSFLMGVKWGAKAGKSAMAAMF